MDGPNNGFSVMQMSDLFSKCAQNDVEEVDMDCYLDAWDELIRFLNLMGSAFTFVSSDVTKKVAILRKFRADCPEEYKSVVKMLAHEKTNGVIKTVQINGSRTLLRLHRALKFLQILFAKLAKNEDKGKVSDMAYNAYHSSPMAKYHPWLVRKAVGVAVYVLPNREGFIETLNQNVPTAELESTMESCSSNMEIIYKHTDALYKENDMLELP